MVIKKSILKDAIREIRYTKKKFISLVLIITLGVGFFVGLKSTYSDMLKTSEKYYKDSNLMDLKVISSTGFEKDDIQSFSQLKEVKGISPSKTLETSATINDKNYTIKLNSINKNKNDENYINRLTLTSGRFPATINEGLVEESLLKDNNLNIGDLVILKPDSNELRAKKIKIVGTVKDSYYASNNRGIAVNGNKINYFMYLVENNFNTNYYNELFITIKGANKYGTYTDEYENFINKNKGNILSISNEITKKRYEQIFSSYTKEVEALQDRLNEIYNSDIPEETLNDEINKAKEKLEIGKNNLEQLKFPISYVLTRNDTSSFYEYKLEAERIKNISKIFPIFFFLVSALVSLTSMTRIVDEERNQIGTLRSIGYGLFSCSFKYLLYALLASILGSLLGSILFYKLIPTLVHICYGVIYEMPNIITTFQIKYVLFASFLACLSTIGATILAFINDARQTPAKLMRPKTPKKGKKIFLEKFDSIWQKLNFSKKITFRNVFRYKKRLIMTVVGIAGCTALLLTSFGLKSSIKNIVDEQFEKINKFDVSLDINASLDQEKINEVQNSVLKNNGISKFTKINKTSITVSKGKKKEVSYLIIPENNNKIKDFISLQKRVFKKELKLNDDGVIISEKLSKLLNINEGDNINITTSSNKKIKVKVQSITENYIDHYVYISKDLYERLTDEDVIYNTMLLKNKSLSSKEELTLYKDINKTSSISNCILTSNQKTSFNKMLKTLDYISIILIISAAVLALVVLYNLSSINISERKRELSTIKVLGFYDKEVTSYVYNENIILTAIGTIIGLIIGSLLTYYVIKACETNNLMYSFKISIFGYILSVVITFVFLLIINFITHFELKKEDMLEALRINE